MQGERGGTVREQQLATRRNGWIRVPTLALVLTRTSAWGTGFVGVFTLRNVGAAAIDGWTLAFDTVFSVHVTSVWGGIWVRGGDHHTVSAETWNRVIAPGTAVDIGFSGEFDDTFIAPRNCALNGVRLDCGAPPDTARPSSYFLDPSSYVPAGRIDLAEGRLDPVWFDPFATQRSPSTGPAGRLLLPMSKSGPRKEIVDGS